jgi:aminopeptidase N
MPQFHSLTREEAEHRRTLLDVTSYDVTLDLTVDTETFHSRTVIRFTSRSGDTFLDVKPKQLRSVALDGSTWDGEEWDRGRLPLTLTEGEHELVIEAVMGFRNDGEGLHRAVDPADGRHYVYGMSFMDAAPSIFACFDQPDLKAPYTLHVAAPEDWLVVGNGRAEQVSPGRWELATTPPLSTYFVTLVAGPYHQVVDEHDGIRLGLEARASLARQLDEQAEEILTITRQSFDELHRLFDIRYAFGDYHQAFVPEFNAGAMENPGCVTFRDPLIFTSRVTRSQHINRATTIAHEMAHQWFGNLVTPAWWDDLWLNESFAEYMGNRVTADATEFSDAWVQTAFVRKTWGLFTDQSPVTHPIAGNGATDATSALQDFDGISYAKGSAALKQLAALMGDEVFFAGARDHFTRHRFANAAMQDLFTSWETAGAGDLSPWTSGWLRTAGLDTITLDRATGSLVRTPPTEHPADRAHSFELALHDGPGGDGAWRRTAVELTAERTPVEVGTAAVVPDPGEATWARFDLDPLTREALPGLVGGIEDPLMRASLLNTVRGNVHNAVMPIQEAVTLVERTLPTEEDETGVQQLGYFATRRLVAWAPDPGAVAARIQAAALDGLDRASAGSGRQLGLFQVALANAQDPGQLRAWLEADRLPEGLELDRDLRWRVLTRLAVLGATDVDELQSQLDRAPDAESTVDHAGARASLPDAESKAWAWRRFLGEESVPNYELEATGLGFWRRGQESVTAPYVERYFAEVAGIAEVHQGWVLPDVAQTFYPFPAFEDALDPARAVIGQDGLDKSLARRLTECLDILERSVAARGLRG